MNSYVLTVKLKRRFENKGKSMICRRCNKPIQPGEEIVSKSSNRRTKQKFYHRSCFEEMLL